MRRLLVLGALSLLAAGAHAQTVLSDRSGEAALGCLVRPAKPPAYPATLLERRSNGTYRLALTFTDAQQPPQLSVLFEAGHPDLRVAAEQYVKQFRLPRLPSGQSVTLVQELAFRGVSDGDVSAPAPLNLPPTPNARHIACLRTPAEGLRLSEEAQLQGFKRPSKNGNVVLELVFTAPDQPPQVKTVYDSVNRRHRDDVLAHASGYRVPCLAPGESFKVRQSFHVSFFDNRGFAFKDVSLVKFLGMVKNLEAKPVHFDLDTMACPFRVRFDLGRPAFSNGVTETGTPNRNRRAFLAWMEELELALTREEYENLLGHELFVDVPCGTIKLG